MISLPTTHHHRHWENTNLTNDELALLNTLKLTNSMVLLIGPYCLLIVGVLGNLLSLRVLFRPSMRVKIFSTYLCSMCMFNILTLLTVMPRLITRAHIGREMIIESDALCILLKYASITFISISHWHTVLLTLTRLLFLIDGTGRIMECMRPRISITTVVLGWVLFNIPLTYFWVRFKDNAGHPVECYLPYRTIHMTIMVVLQALVPIVFLIFIDALIICMHFKKMSSVTRARSTLKVKQHLIVVTFASSIQFVLTTFPTSIINGNGALYFDGQTQIGEARTQLAISVTAMILYMNESTNFLIFCCFGRKFKRELVVVLFTCKGLDCRPTQIKKSGMELSLQTKVASVIEPNVTISSSERDSSYFKSISSQSATFTSSHIIPSPPSIIKLPSDRCLGHTGLVSSV